MSTTMGNRMSSKKQSDDKTGRVYRNDYSSQFTLIDCLDQNQMKLNDDQSQKELLLVASKVPIPKGNVTHPDDTTCITIENVLSVEECTKIIQRSEDVQFQQALVNIGIGEILDKDYRNSDRCIIDDMDFASVLFERIRPYLPATVNSAGYDHWKLCGLNERMRILRYSEEHFFAPHRDGCYMRNTEEMSFMTIMIYLNSNFEGGSTNLISSTTSSTSSNTPSLSNDTVEVVPKPGMVFVFDHTVKHEGARVTHGVKYAIRTDIMYRAEKKLREVRMNDTIVLKEAPK
eukprot:CAMPEP_0204644552 /NCGR_PEP_ID=MMETSP0718-20130828/1563_1 /ASSEMBLY_ACC=CAM_ASM_000674 /TAXON_ID=230516 /ORGANISM="Chaetoceros curvisetus" /LENGTH=287 /DNA_ID=CAMNT_0051666165 /DNA_START=21 /DNA_END=885 /DNA_ORIENTATION=-